MSKFGNLGGGGMFPPVIKGLLIANVAVFLLQHFFIGTLTLGGVPLGNVFIQYFALWQINLNNLIPFTGDYQFYPWQLLTYQFMHADFWHLFMNMFALWMFGIELEKNWGPKRFILYYLLAGIGAALIHMMITPFFGEVRPTIGASGAIYGILLAFGLTFPNRPIFMFPLFIPIPAKYFVMIFAGIELINGVSGSSGVAHFAHLGGALTGFIMLKYSKQVGFEKLLSLFSGGQYYDKSYDTGNFANYTEESYPKPKAPIYKANWVSTKPEVAAPVYRTESNVKKYVIDGEEITQLKIDVILDKISASGYQNLTEREKFILTELSKKL
jgi:membrane associated rhomboid family serine protease